MWLSMFVGCFRAWFAQKNRRFQKLSTGMPSVSKRFFISSKKLSIWPVRRGRGQEVVPGVAGGGLRAVCGAHSKSKSWGKKSWQVSTTRDFCALKTHPKGCWRVAEDAKGLQREMRSPNEMRAPFLWNNGPQFVLVERKSGQNALSAGWRVATLKGKTSASSFKCTSGVWITAEARPSD